MESLIIILAMVASAALTLSLITLNKYNSYHKLLNTIERNVHKFNEKQEVITQELDAARKDMTLLVESNNESVKIVTQLQKVVTDITAAKMSTAPVANRSYVPARHG